MDRGAWWATVHRVAIAGHDLATEQQQQRFTCQNAKNLESVFLCSNGVKKQHSSAFCWACKMGQSLCKAI